MHVLAEAVTLQSLRVALKVVNGDVQEAEAGIVGFLGAVDGQFRGRVLIPPRPPFAPARAIRCLPYGKRPVLMI